MSSSVPVAHDSGLEVDLRHGQMENEGLHKRQGDNEGLHHVYGPYVVSKEPDGYSRRILGLSIGMFWLVVAVIVLVLAGGIGGGVAGGLAAQKNSCSQSQASSSTSLTLASATSSLSPSQTTPPSTTSSSISTTTSAATGIPSPQISTPCTGPNPSANGSTLFAVDASGSNSVVGTTPHTFLLLCNTNYPSGAAYGNPNLVDLLVLYTPDMVGCITACAEYNTGYAVSSGGPRCAAVAVVKAPGQFCYLKSATGVNNTSSSGGAPIDSAILTV